MKTMCLVAAVDETYAPYVPLFKYCAKKAYPEYDCVVFGIGNIPGTIGIEPLEHNHSRFVPASMRFLVGDEILSNYEFCLITDCDIMIRREDPDIVQQHGIHMFCNRLKCYDNTDRGDHMPGVHFVTDEWWDATRIARAKCLEKLKEKRDMQAGEDEIMLKDIVTLAGLPTHVQMIMWSIHGMHLGQYRDCNINSKRFQPGEFGFIDELLGDVEFMSLMSIARSKSEMIDKTWRNVIAINALRNQ